MDVTQVALTWVEWLNGEKLALICMQIRSDQSEPKSMQVHTSPGQMELQVDPVFNLHLLGTLFGQGFTPSLSPPDCVICRLTCGSKKSLPAFWVMISAFLVI